MFLDHGRHGAHTLQRLDAALRLAGLRRLCLEAVDETLQMLARRIVPGLRLHLQFVGFRLLPLELVIGATIEGEFLLVEMNDRIDGGVQEVTIVADDDDRVRIAADIVLEPQRAFEVEVVGRLVEKKQVGLGKENGRQRHAHAPAAGEGRGRTALRLMVEAKTGENARRARFRGVGTDVGKPRLNVGNPVRIGRGLGLGDERRAFLVRLEHDLDQRLLCAGRFLRHLADTRIFRQRHTAGFGRKLAGNHPEERRFTRPVASDEPRLRARR